jgi:hypothetical protein
VAELVGLQRKVAIGEVGVRFAGRLDFRIGEVAREGDALQGPEDLLVDRGNLARVLAP